MHPAEEAMVRAFIAPHRRDRWLMSLADGKRRSGFLDRLNHYFSGDFDPRFCSEIGAGVDPLGLMVARGAPSRCYLVSADAALDGREMGLAEAFPAVLASGWGTVVNCVSGRLAYFAGERGVSRFLLERVAHR